MLGQIARATVAIGQAFGIPTTFKSLTVLTVDLICTTVTSVLIILVRSSELQNKRRKIHSEVGSGSSANPRTIQGKGIWVK